MWALLADLHAGHRAIAMTEGEVAVSLAGVLTPALVSMCAATSLSWRFSLVLASGLVLATAVAVRLSRLPDAEPASPDRQGGPPDADGAHGPRRTLITVLAVVGLEFTLNFWAASYLHDDVGLPRDTSVALVSSLYAANLVGRLVASRLARRTAAPVLLRIFLAVTLVGLPILLSAGNIVVAGIGLSLTGMGIGGTFPLASSLHVAASPRTADQALGQILTVAGLGQIIGPLLAGALGQAAGLRLGLMVLPALVLVAAATTRRIRGRVSGGSTRTRTNTGATRR
jgi:fucose permease